MCIVLQMVMDSLSIDKKAGNSDFICQGIPLDEIAFVVSMHLNDRVYNLMGMVFVECCLMCLLKRQALQSFL